MSTTTCSPQPASRWHLTDPHSTGARCGCSGSLGSPASRGRGKGYTGMVRSRPSLLRSSCVHAHVDGVRHVPTHTEHSEEPAGTSRRGSATHDATCAAPCARGTSTAITSLRNTRCDRCVHSRGTANLAAACLVGCVCVQQPSPPRSHTARHACPRAARRGACQHLAPRAWLCHEGLTEPRVWCDTQQRGVCWHNS